MKNKKNINWLIFLDFDNTYILCQSGNIFCVHSFACLANLSSILSDSWIRACRAAASRSTFLLAASTILACSALWRSASSVHLAGRFEGLEINSHSSLTCCYPISYHFEFLLTIESIFCFKVVSYLFKS